jgi:hypothetical protein
MMLRTGRSVPEVQGGFLAVVLRRRFAILELPVVRTSDLFLSFIQV